MRTWTPEQRAKQAEVARRHRPWEKSTGPTSPQGKAKARLNAHKHGRYDAERRALRRLLRESGAVIRFYNELLRAQKRLAREARQAVLLKNSGSELLRKEKEEGRIDLPLHYFPNKQIPL